MTHLRQRKNIKRRNPTATRDDMKDEKTKKKREKWSILAKITAKIDVFLLFFSFSRLLVVSPIKLRSEIGRCTSQPQETRVKPK